MRILHLFDSHTSWEQRVAAQQLLHRLPSKQHTQFLAIIDAQEPHSNPFNGAPVIHIPRRVSLNLFTAPAVRRLIADHSIDLIHAWSTRVARTAAAARSQNCALILWRSDPHIAQAEARLLRTLGASGPFAVSCNSGTVRRRLIEKGVPADQCVVVRPGVDFGSINEARKDTSLRARLGLTPEDHIVLLSEPVCRRGGHERAVFAGHLRQNLSINHRMLFYGDNSETRRLKRLSHPMPMSEGIVWSGDELPYEQIIAISDALLVPAFDDVPTTSIAWAMAARVPIVATAVYSIAELIAHKHNGLLIKPEPGPPMAVRIAKALNQTDSMQEQIERAQGQAYEVFSIRRFADQHLQLYKNLTTGAAPNEAITDSAFEQ